MASQLVSLQCWLARKAKLVLPHHSSSAKIPSVFCAVLYL